MPAKQPDAFARRLRSLRETAGLSVSELAQRAGVTRQCLYLLESGQRQPTLQVARQLATALGRELACWQ